MRKLSIMLAAAATLGMAAPAVAGDDVSIGFGTRGWWGGPSHGAYAYDRGWRGGSAYNDCRTVRVRERLPDGRVIIRTRSSC